MSSLDERAVLALESIADSLRVLAAGDRRRSSKLRPPPKRRVAGPRPPEPDAPVDEIAAARASRVLRRHGLT